MTAQIRNFLICAVLIAFSFFLYWDCRNGAFIWDDQFLVVKNPLIRSPVLIFEAFRHFLGEEPASNFYRPIQTLTYLFDYWRGGLNSTIYHDGNIFIHGLNASLVYLFIRGLLKREAAASEKSASFCGLLAALLWVAHPIHSATVAYIAGRADSLALFFLLAGWCFWDLFLKTNGFRRWLLASLIFLCGFLAVCSKEAALIGIAVFLFTIVFSKNQTTTQQKMVVSGGCLFLLTIYLVLRNSIGPGEASQATGTLGNRFILVLRALGDYLCLLFFPGNLRMERQIVMVPNLFRDPVTFDPLYPYLILPGLIFVAILVVSAIRPGRFLRVRRFGTFWFVATILPVSNVFALNATIAEHWLYLPSIGFLLILAGWILETSPNMQRIFATGACLAIVGLTIRTKIRVLDWVSPIAFFEATIRDGGDTARMRVNLANEYQLHGNPKRGEELLRSVLVLSPGYAQARHALVVNLMIQGKTQEANELFAKEANPFGESFRGKLYAVQRLTADGEVHKSAEILSKMRAQFPDSWLLTKEIGQLFDKMGQPEQKISLYQNFATNHWWHAESHLQVARLCEISGRRDEAVTAYLQAARLDVRDTASAARAEKLNSGK